MIKPCSRADFPATYVEHDALPCFPRPGAECGDYRRAHGGILRAGGPAAHLFLHARYPENLSGASGLGPVSHTTWARGSPLLPAATGDALEIRGAFLNNAGALGREVCVLGSLIYREVFVSDFAWLLSPSYAIRIA